jgi:hypothetical protein
MAKAALMYTELQIEDAPVVTLSSRDGPLWYAAVVGDAEPLGAWWPDVFENCTLAVWSGTMGVAPHGMDTGKAMPTNARGAHMWRMSDFLDATRGGHVLAWEDVDVYDDSAAEKSACDLKNKKEMMSSMRTALVWSTPIKDHTSFMLRAWCVVVERHTTALVRFDGVARKETLRALPPTDYDAVQYGCPSLCQATPLQTWTNVSVAALNRMLMEEKEWARRWRAMLHAWVFAPGDVWDGAAKWNGGERAWRVVGRRVLESVVLCPSVWTPSDANDWTDALNAWWVSKQRSVSEMPITGEWSDMALCVPPTRDVELDALFKMAVELREDGMQTAWSQPRC